MGSSSDAQIPNPLRPIGNESALQLAQEALRTSEARFRTMVDQLTISAVFREGDRLSLNRMAEKYLGYSREEIPTIQRWFELLHVGEIEAARARYETYRAAGFPRAR